MDGRPEADIVTMLPFRALKREHHNVERTAVGGGGDLQVLVDVSSLLQVCEELTFGPHLPGSFPGIEVSGVGSVVWSSDRIEALTAFGPAEFLKVITGDQPPHTEGNDGEFIILTPFCLDNVAKLPGHGLKALAPVHRLERRHEAFVASGDNGLAQRVETDAGVKNAVDQNDPALGYLTGLGRDLVTLVRSRAFNAAGSHGQREGEKKDNGGDPNSAKPALRGSRLQILHETLSG